MTIEQIPEHLRGRPLNPSVAQTGGQRASCSGTRFPGSTPDVPRAKPDPAAAAGSGRIGDGPPSTRVAGLPIPTGALRCSPTSTYGEIHMTENTRQAATPATDPSGFGAARRGMIDGYSVTSDHRLTFLEFLELRKLLQYQHVVGALVCLSDRPMRYGELGSALTAWTGSRVGDGEMTRTVHRLTRGGLTREAFVEGHRVVALAPAGVRHLSAICGLRSALRPDEHRDLALGKDADGQAA